MKKTIILLISLVVSSIPALAQEQMSKEEYLKNYKMTRKEFLEKVGESFDSRDKNHDGVLTMDEIAGQAPTQPATPNQVQTYHPAVAARPEPDDEDDNVRKMPETGSSQQTSIPPATSIPAVGR